jgi:hypothetical protein
LSPLRNIADPQWPWCRAPPDREDEGEFMAFADDLKQLSEQVRKRQVNVKGEEATKQSLILPFLTLLGFDIYDPMIVKPEYIADFAKKKSNGQMEKVDYALQVAGQPAIFIECKAVEAQLPNHDAQLARYFNAETTVKLAIICNGVSYRFFTDMKDLNIMDDQPFFDFNLLAFKDRDVEVLSHYTATSFRADQVQKHAQELVFIQKIGGLLSELLRSPSEQFVRFLLNELHLHEGNVTAKVVERFVPLAHEAMRTALVEIMTHGVTREMSGNEQAAATPAASTSSPTVLTASALRTGLAPVAPPARTSDPGDEGPDAAKVAATAEDLDVFERVKKIVAPSPSKVAVVYKATTSYFALNLGKVTRWFMRFYGSGAVKHVVLRIPLERAANQLGGMNGTAVNVNETRVNVTSSTDVDKIAAAVLAAYETEVHRKDAGTDVEH